MDVQRSSAKTYTPGDSEKVGAVLTSRAATLTPGRVGEALGRWQHGELRLARSFPQCRGLSHEQLEDLYQETTLMLLRRPYQSEEHLRNALRWGIKHRALHLHRDERRRGEILAQRAPELRLAAESREAERGPELAALLEDDRMIVTEFLAELSELERRVFWLMAEGMRYRAIAPVLAVSVNEARKAARGCEGKRERFQLLYDTGRLCGFRAETIMAMQAGASVAEELAQRAYAHLEACVGCRAHHKTNARRLRRSFQGQAAALAPIPALAGHLGWLAKLDLRMRALHERVLPYGAPPGSGGVRERAIAMLASGGAAAKLAAGAATVAVLAGGAIGATRALQQEPPAPPRRIARRAVESAARASARPAIAVLGGEARRAEAQPQRRTQVHNAEGSPGGQHSEPGGFAYLGVPSASGPASRSPARARSATVASPPRAGSGGAEEQRGGGPFSP